MMHGCGVLQPTLCRGQLVLPRAMWQPESCCRCLTTGEGARPASTSSNFLVIFVKDVPEVPPSPHLPPLPSFPLDLWPLSGFGPRLAPAVAGDQVCLTTVNAIE